MTGSNLFKPETLDEIEAKLQLIEAHNDVKILYASESGSRAWGFASPNSDYDVRFIFARDVRSYLRLRPMRDVIELPIENDLDINGWDIIKALNLLRNSNPPLIDWLNSPIIYREEGSLAASLRTLTVENFSPKRMTYHYLSMAKGTYKSYIEHNSEVAHKKYLYLMRPLLCIRWIEQYGTPAPTSLCKTLEGIELPDTILSELNNLLRLKQSSEELGIAPTNLMLNEFGNSEITRISDIVTSLPDPDFDEKPLNSLLWDLLGVGC